MLLRARTVLPIGSPPIEDGAVLVRGARIENVGFWKDLRKQTRSAVVDLGDSIILPGLINAHCHLDYTDMAGQLSAGRKFSDWIKAIVALKAQWSYSEFASSWLKGAHALLHSGTTTVVDIEAVPELLPDVLPCSPLRVISCLELLSVRTRISAAQLVQSATHSLEGLRTEAGGLSPHAPYSTSGALLRAAAETARSRQWLFTTHVAESADEVEMFQRGTGAMFKWLQPQRDMGDCDGRSPVQHLSRNRALGKHCLAVHANYLAAGDVELLAQTGTTVVHCPRSHDFFGHRDFPFEELSRAGVNICLGTDSMATVAKSRSEPFSLNLFSEMRTLARNQPNVSPQRVLELVTINAAQAIGRPDALGVLKPGANADLIVLPNGDRTESYETALHHRGELRGSMIRGAWAIAPTS
jgi:aminodeoxyfutalosine deaminase